MDTAELKDKSIRAVCWSDSCQNTDSQSFPDKFLTLFNHELINHKHTFRFDFLLKSCPIRHINVFTVFILGINYEQILRVFFQTLYGHIRVGKIILGRFKLHQPSTRFIAWCTRTPRWTFIAFYVIVNILAGRSGSFRLVPKQRNRVFGFVNKFDIFHNRRNSYEREITLYYW